MNPTLIAAAIGAVVAVALGAAGGYRYADAQGAAALSSLQKAEAEKREFVAQAGAARLIAANRSADELTARVAASDAARSTASQERDRALKQLTTGRACLDGTVVRLLNHSAGPHLGDVPAAADQSADAVAAAASDSDVAQWIDGARDKYDACRDRIDAVRTWRDGQVAASAQ